MIVSLRNFVKGTEGTIMVLTALGLVAFLGFASLAIDMGHLYVVRNELQNVADAAALAGANKLIVEQDGEVVRDSAAAQQAVMDVAQRQSVLSGLTPVDAGSRNDLTVAIGNWNIYTGNPDTAWTSDLINANAVRVTIRRGEGVAFGPVANFLAGILGSPTSEVAATATAYLGFVQSAATGSVNLPLAVPDTAITAANPQPKPWYARLLGPREAWAAASTKKFFKDRGSNNLFYNGDKNKPQIDYPDQQAYLVLVGDEGKNDPVPATIKDNLINQADSTKGKPVRPMKRGDRLYPISEYQWAPNIDTIFKNLKAAYNKKQVNGKYKAMVPVYTTSNPMASRLEKSWKALAGLFSFGPSPAHACFKFWEKNYTDDNRNFWVDGFTTVNVTKVEVLTPVPQKDPTSATECSNCNNWGEWGYSSQAQCMVDNPKSCANLDYAEYEIPQGSTTSNFGTTSGGPDNEHINPSGGSPGKGSFAKAAKLVR